MPTTFPAGILELRPDGLYCPDGGFFIDPWRPVDRAVITHAHSDHARSGSQRYLTSASGADLLRLRVGKGASIESVPYGRPVRIGAASVSLHPAGHILGSAQIRIEAPGKPVCVVSGDYNATHQSPSCEPFEPVACEVFITESTFGLPIYRWPEPRQVFEEIRSWWRGNRANGLTSILPAYPLGKSQRLLAGLLNDCSEETPIAVHGNANTFIPLYRAAGVRLPEVETFTELRVSGLRGRGLIITSSAADDSALRGLGDTALGFASGWMMTRAARRSQAFDRGFVLSDHSDWDGLLLAIRATGAHHIGVTHGETRNFTRWLNENGWNAFPVPTRFSDSGREESDTTDQNE